MLIAYSLSMQLILIILYQKFTWEADVILLTHMHYKTTVITLKQMLKTNIELH